VVIHIIFKWQVRAEDRGTPPQQDTTTVSHYSKYFIIIYNKQQVNIIVLDVNEFTPTFDSGKNYFDTLMIGNYV